MAKIKGSDFSTFSSRLMSIFMISVLARREVVGWVAESHQALEFATATVNMKNINFYYQKISPWADPVYI